ncbi:MAG: hypothetical protein ACREX4_12770 [Gammaproteobacteria bacterium]
MRLLDVKAARKPAFAVGLHLPCPPGVDDAERIIQAQRLILDRPSAPIAAIDLLGDRFTVREVQPSTRSPTMPLIGLVMSPPPGFFSRTPCTMTGGPTYRLMTRAPSQFDQPNCGGMR